MNIAIYSKRVTKDNQMKSYGQTKEKIKSGKARFLSYVCDFFKFSYYRTAKFAICVKAFLKASFARNRASAQAEARSG